MRKVIVSDQKNFKCKLESTRAQFFTLLFAVVMDKVTKDARKSGEKELL